MNEQGNPLITLLLLAHMAQQQGQAQPTQQQQQPAPQQRKPQTRVNQNSMAQGHNGILGKAYGHFGKLAQFPFGRNQFTGG